MNEQQSQGGGMGASPILILGIIVFVMPFFNFIVPWFPGWLKGVGIVLIIIGAIHSIFG